MRWGLEPAASRLAGALRSRAARRLGAALAAAVATAVGAAYAVPLPDRLEEAGSPVVQYRDGTAAAVFLSPDDRWRVPVDLDDVDPAYVAALIDLEDSRFYAHPGVDPIAIGRAAVQNAQAGEVVSGGSTITMQLVRVLEPRPRTMRSKAIESLRAMQLELRMSKRDILAAYLTYVPYGRNVEGIEAASLAYFGHSADALTPAEIATLLAVPQDPTGRYPTPGHQPVLAAARNDIAERLLADDALPLGDPPETPEAVLAEIASTPAPDHLRPEPRQAMHASDWMRRRAGNPDRLKTTLDRGVQSLAERTLGAARPELEVDGIHNAAIVVVDHRSGEIRGLVGGFDYWSGDHGSQIAAFDVPRSTGSALKPFIYARAIDDGIVLPDDLVEDIPLHFGGWSPENFDGRFNGVVRVEDALSRSLNIPFVELLQKVGVEPFLGDLRAMGAEHLDPTPGHYGLSAAAGGIELTPLEMAGLYVSLAEGGVSKPLRWRPGGADDAAGTTMYSPGAAWLTRRALAIRDRPDFPNRRQLTGAPAGIHWKTGTSYGYRDAWAIGSGDRYTVAVWLGNLDNHGTVHLVGAEAAGPILFDLLEALGQGKAAVADPPPADLAPIEVCSLTGYLATDACPRKKRVLARTAKVPTERCPFHVQLEVDDANGLAVTPSCRAGRDTHVDTYVQWPTEVRRWLDDSWRGQATAPGFAPGCEPPSHDPPKIVSPAAAQIVLLIPGVPADRQEVPLEGTSDAPGAQLSWFVDGRFLGTARADERLWWTPEAGTHDLLVLDDAGLAGRQRIEVRAGL